MSHSNPTDSVLLADRTWTEVETALESGTDTAIVPVGSLEQHGPHLPLATDSLIGEELAARIARRLGDALVAPVIRPGCSGHHMAFPGSITVSASTLIEVLRSYCESLAEHGFETVALLPSHGGNFAPVNTAAPEIADETELGVVALADMERYMDLMNEGMERAELPPEPVVHAGGTETSAILAIRPELVRESAFEPGRDGPVDTTLLLSRGFKSITDNGVLGDPSQSSEAAGEAILETIADAYAADVRAGRDAFE